MYSIAILGTAPLVGATPPPPRNSTNLSIRSSRTIVSFLSRRLVIRLTPLHRTHPETSPRLGGSHKRGRVRSRNNTLRLSSSALFGSRLATRFYDASSLFSVSGLRLFRCCDFVFVSICATTSPPCLARPLLCPSSYFYLPLVEPSSSTHAFVLRIARPFKIICCTSGNLDYAGTPKANGLTVSFFFLAGFLSISTTAESGIFAPHPTYSHDDVLHLCTLLEAFA